ncbi:purine and uridine phosphorylase, partial [Aureobasidium melanogenum]
MSDPHQYTVGWICAIPTESIAASLFLDDEEHERPDHVSINDSNNYTLGKMKGHNVVIAVLPDGEYGQTSATSVVKDMLASFPNIRIGLMVGIGGGAPTAQNDIRLGDVVVSSPQNKTGGVYQYDYGKLIQGQGFQQTGFLNQPSTLVRTTVSGLKTQYKRRGHKIDETIKAVLNENPRLADEFSRPREDRDRLYKADFVHPVGHKGDCNDSCGVLPERIVERRARTQKEDNPAIHHGIIASGNWLLKDASVRDAFANEKGIMCFEMEAAGLMNHLPCLVIRGICDYSDSHKNKEWQGMVPSQVQAEQKVAEALKSIQHNTMEIIETSNNTAACVNDLKADARYHRIYSWLAPPDHTTNQHEALSQRHEGTGQWFVRSAIFTAFKEGRVPFLWLSGIPGCGKTILSSSIIEDLQHNSSNSSAAILYFYFNFNDNRKQTLDTALRSLLWQLTNHGGSSFREVEKLYESCNGGQNQTSTQSLIRALESVLQATGRVIIVLDALDECTTRRELLQWLAETSAKNSSGIQIIATSRKEYDIKDAFAKWLTNDVMLSIQQLEVDQDIQAYVHARIRSDPGLERWRDKPFVQNEIELKLTKKAQGMFRWAKCQLDSLAECLCLRMLHKALNTLPKTLDETYARILEHLPPMYLQDTIRLLQILTWSERPLLIEEAVDYLAVELDSKPGFDEENRLPVPREIMRFCSSLVTVAQVSEDTLGYSVYMRLGTFETYRSQEEIRLAHYSVKEYLTSGRGQINEIGFQLGQATSATYIASAMLTYLLHLQTNVPNHAIIAHCPLAMYSASHWMEFARVANAEDSRLRILIERLLLVPERYAHWISLFNPPKRWIWGDDKKPSFPLPQPLYYASLGGLEYVVNRLLESGADINSEGDEYDNALQAAAARGLESMVNLLLQKGADVNAHRGKASTLQVASAEGHVRVVQSLLAHGADVNAEGGDDLGHISALQAACAECHLEVIKLLLENGADVNIRGGARGTALQVASLVGCDKIVQLLLQEGADVNAPGSSGYGEALDAAFGRTWGDCDLHHNREQVVLLLLGKCDGLDVQDKRFANVLHNAAGAGFENVVKRLLTTHLDIIAREGRGLDIDVLSRVYGDALDIAAEEGHVKIVQMLLDRRPEVIAEGEVYGSALAAASYEGHDDVVQMLLDRDADVNIIGGCYGSALQAASRAGHGRIVKMLLQNAINIDVDGTLNSTAFDIALQWGYTDVLETLLKLPGKETIADEHGWSSEAFLIIYRGLTPRGISRDSTSQNARALGHTPTRFVEAGQHSGFRFSEDGLEITAGHALNQRIDSDYQARADHPIPAGLDEFFFEVEIVRGSHDSKCELVTQSDRKTHNRIAIGLCTGSSSQTEAPGSQAGSWAYYSVGFTKSGGTGRAEQYNEGYDKGDTVCCGVHFKSNTIDFYKNGISLGTAFEGVNGRLFPVIGIANRDVHLRIRFRPEEFLFPPRAS